MKKLIVVLSCILVLAVGVFATYSGVTAKDDGKWHKDRIADEALYPDGFKYVDYAKDVKLDKEKYPDLQREGMFWCRWDEASNQVVRISAETEEGAALVDTSKPTIINVHGMQVDGYMFEEAYWLSEACSTETEVGYEYPVQMTKFWLDKGWNVGIYNYNTFGSEGINYWDIEEKVWATNGLRGMRYQAPDQSYVENVCDYSLGELFAADYIRAVNMLPDDFGKAEIRLAAHSMGGEVVAAGLFLLTELADADVGQIDRDKLPDRYAMEDTFFGVTVLTNGKLLYIGQKGLICRWSGKGLPDDKTSSATIEALRDIANAGIALEYYSYNSSFLTAALTNANRSKLLSACTYIFMCPDYEGYGKGYSILTDGHNAVRTYYLTSILNDYPTDDSALTDAQKVAYAANMKTEDLLRLRGRAFYITSGQETLTTNDDAFREVTEQEIMFYDE